MTHVNCCDFDETLSRAAKTVAGEYLKAMKLLPGLKRCSSSSLPRAIVTNGPSDMQRAASRHVGLEDLDTLMVGDEDVSARKPRPIY